MTRKSVVRGSHVKLAAGSMPAEIGYGVVGLGLMGRTHILALEHARKSGVACRLVAVSDRDPARFDGRAEASGNVQKGRAGARLFDPSVVQATTEAAELFANPNVHAVSICTHTDTHVELATLVEKLIRWDDRL